MRTRNLFLLVTLIWVISITFAEDVPKKESNGKIHEMLIQTMKGYLVFIKFASWDKIVRVDVGNRSLFGAEASKDYPNFLVLYQRGNRSAMRTNITALMESGHLFHFLVKGSDGKEHQEERQKVYDLSNEYDIPEPAAVKTVALSKAEPVDDLEKKLERKVADRVQAIEAESAKRADRYAKEMVINSMRHDVHQYEKREHGEGLTVYVHEIRPFDKSAFVSFTVLNNSNQPIELLQPRVTIDNVQKKKLRRQNAVPTERLDLQGGHIPPKGITRGVIAFRADSIRDSSQSYVLNIARVDKADKTVKVKLF